MSETPLPTGSVSVPTGANKPRAMYAIDPRLFIPIAIFVLIGMFGHPLIFTLIMFGCAGFTYAAGCAMGVLSPYFIDECSRWLDWRVRTGNGEIAPDAYFFGRNSISSTKRRPE